VFGCEPHRIDYRVHAKKGPGVDENVGRELGLGVADASDSRTMDVMRADAIDQEEMGDSRTRPRWKLSPDGDRWPPPVLQGEDFHPTVFRPPFEVKGALSVREELAPPV
jgi:hypothetical protein